MRRALVILLVAAASLLGAQADAHHPRGATYLENQTITIEGQLVQLFFRNPHSFVHVIVREKNGTVVRYAVEWGGAVRLEDQGVAHDTLKIGDRVIISGNPGRNRSDRVLRMLTLQRPRDGFGWGLRPGEVVE